jgi:two-component system, NarL family, response regulator NreC
MLVRVLIADDSGLVRSGLHELIEDHADWVCAEAVNGHDAIMKTQDLAPDLVVLDLFYAHNGRTPGGPRNL